MTEAEQFITYIRSVRRYSARTVEIYSDVIGHFLEFSSGTSPEEALTPGNVRAYEVYMMDDEGLGARTVNQHLSILSSFSRFLMKEGKLKLNPIRSVHRPKEEKRLPLFYRSESMNEYFESHVGTLEYGGDEERLRYMIISLLEATGIRRSELIGLNEDDFDPMRGSLRVVGKGNKEREIPLGEKTVGELNLYLASAPEPEEEPAPLIRSSKGKRLYPVYVDRTVKRELGPISSITVRRSPHVLRHTIATQLLSNGADLNSIKELLGHSSLAATQVYTHNTVEKLRKVYTEAHPRAKKSK